MKTKSSSSFNSSQNRQVGYNKYKNFVPIYEMMALSMLLSKPGCPYQLGKQLKERVNYQLHISSGQLSRPLADMENEGFVISKSSISKGHLKKVYHMTPKGETYYQKLKKEYLFKNRLIQEFMASCEADALQISAQLSKEEKSHSNDRQHQELMPEAGSAAEVQTKDHLPG